MKIVHNEYIKQTRREADTMTAQAKTTKQTAANNPVLARIKKIASGETYRLCTVACNVYDARWAALVATRKLFAREFQDAWEAYFLTGSVGDGSISAETAEAWGIAQ